MNIQTVITNLRNTIAGKEAFAEKLREEVNPSNHTKVLLGFLAVNLQELRAILDNLVKCEAQGVEQSWRLNPDRMGGQFSQDEIYDMNRSGWIEP